MKLIKFLGGKLNLILRKRNFMKNFILNRTLKIILFFIIIFSMVGCSNKTSKSAADINNQDWDSIVQSAKGTTVQFYGWGGNDLTNKWVDTYLAKNLKDKYDITLKRVPMDIDDIINKLLGEKQARSTKGTIDMIWINGENFYTASKNGLLYGSVPEKLPNFNKYIDKNSADVAYDFGFPVKGYEVPYGKSQFVIIGDSNKVNIDIKDHNDLMSFVKNNPGKFTYPAPPDFTGSAFVRNIIYDIVGYEKFMNMKPDKEVVEKEIKPAIDYLKALKPYLWNKGNTYPATIAQLDNMYMDGQVYMSMSYNPNAIPAMVEKGLYPKTSQSFVFQKGTIGNTHFIAIPYNSPNKAGAIVALNYIISVEAQASKYNPQNWGDLPVVDNNKLDASERKIFEAVKIGQGVIPQDILLKHRVPEMPANLVPIIEKIWLENIPKGD